MPGAGNKRTHEAIELLRNNYFEGRVITARKTLIVVFLRFFRRAEHPLA